MEKLVTRLRLILAFRNRRELTVRSISSAISSARLAGFDLSITVFDDGSDDATDRALLEIDSTIEVIHGDGSNYWAKSMATAESAVLSSEGGADEYIVWLNDDVDLDPEAFRELIDVSRTSEPGSIVVGGTRDPKSGEPSYGGFVNRGLHPLGFRFVHPTGAVQRIDTFNGNIVLVPRPSAELLGGIDGGFSHSLADIDYGLRAKKLGILVLLAPKTIGVCARNPANKREKITAEWEEFRGIKGGGHPDSMRRVLQRHSPLLWWAFMTSTYTLWWVRALLRPARFKL